MQNGGKNVMARLSLMGNQGKARIVFKINVSEPERIN